MSLLNYIKLYFIEYNIHLYYYLIDVIHYYVYEQSGMFVTIGSMENMAKQLFIQIELIQYHGYR